MVGADDAEVIIAGPGRTIADAATVPIRPASGLITPLPSG